jgi:hypothetical protein
MQREMFILQPKPNVKRTLLGVAKPRMVVRQPYRVGDIGGKPAKQQSLHTIGFNIQVLADNQLTG